MAWNPKNDNNRKSPLSLHRRKFMTQVSAGVMAIGVGSSLASELGFCSEYAIQETDARLDFGSLAGLVDMMQSVAPEKLQRKLVGLLRSGKNDLKDLTAAAALANAETFGGEDYVGYHAEMALMPALRMSQLMPAGREALPVLKVIYRNSQRIQKVGGRKKKTLKKLNVAFNEVSDVEQKIRDASRARQGDRAESLFAGAGQRLDRSQQLTLLLPMIEDDINVHRFVLAHRMHEIVDLVGAEHANTMLRQCVRYCVFEEELRVSQGRKPSAIRDFLPKVLDEHKLLGKEPGSRDPGDDWVGKTADEIYRADSKGAGRIVADALSEGVSPEVVGEALSLAANQYVLRQGAKPWRTHGASHGVHGSDAVNSWRHIVRHIPNHQKAAGLIVAAFHTGKYNAFPGEPYPEEAHREKIKTEDAKELLGIAEEAIRANDQGSAAAAIHIYGEQGHAEKPVFDLMLKYAVSEDGRLHAEKYYQSVSEEFGTIRSAYRWRELVALARVSASAYGYDVDDQKGHRASGYEQACQLLGVEA